MLSETPRIGMVEAPSELTLREREGVANALRFAGSTKQGQRFAGLTQQQCLDLAHRIEWGESR